MDIWRKLGIDKELVASVLYIIVMFFILGQLVK